MCLFLFFGSFLLQPRRFGERKTLSTSICGYSRYRSLGPLSRRNFKRHSFQARRIENGTEVYCQGISFLKSIDEKFLLMDSSPDTSRDDDLKMMLSVINRRRTRESRPKADEKNGQNMRVNSGRTTRFCVELLVINDSQRRLGQFSRICMMACDDSRIARFKNNAKSVNIHLTSFQDVECAIKILRFFCHRQLASGVARESFFSLPKRQRIINFRIHLRRLNLIIIHVGASSRPNYNNAYLFSF